MDINANEFLWSQKYRPQTIDDCILPQATKDIFNEYVKQGQLPNFLFTGTAGVGKTTVAMALCNMIGAEFLLINGSEESGIDTLRTKIMGFATSVSLTDAKKVIIIDEADGLNPNSFQPALRATMESVSANCRFILTCNFKAKIIEPIHSRCAVVDFKLQKDDKPKIASAFLKRLVEILKLEKIEYDQKVLADLVIKHFPDFRRILNELQKYAATGKIDTGILATFGDEQYKELVAFMKAKKFNDVRKWVGRNSDLDFSHIVDNFYSRAVEMLDPKSIPQLILILADYQKNVPWVINQEVNTMAALTEIMSSCEFK